MPTPTLTKRPTKSMVLVHRVIPPTKKVRPTGEAILPSTGISWKPMEFTEDAIVVRSVPPGTRRLRELSPETVRVLECRLKWGRQIHMKSDDLLSHELDIHPDDLDALAATQQP